MKNWWLKFGCFLTGYNYEIIKSSSEASAKAVKKYTSAILIVSIIWFFVGYTFADRYLQLDVLGSVIGALIMVFIAIQIERQIILTVGKNNWGKLFRGLIAIVMAILGSIIIDQIIFQDDIELRKEQVFNERVDNALPGKVNEINIEISRLDSLIQNKESERKELIKEVTDKPIIKMPGFETIKKPGKVSRVIIDEYGNPKTIKVDTIFTERKYSSSSVENPKAQLIPQIDNQILELSAKRDSYNMKKISIRSDLEKDLKSKVGFIDELVLMKEILMEKPVAFVVWGLWFLFLLFIELFVVMSKVGKDNETDYDVIVKHQRDMRIKAINKLKQESSEIVKESSRPSFAGR